MKVYNSLYIGCQHARSYARIWTCYYRKVPVGPFLCVHYLSLRVLLKRDLTHPSVRKHICRVMWKIASYDFYTVKPTTTHIFFVYHCYQNLCLVAALLFSTNVTQQRGIKLNENHYILNKHLILLSALAVNDTAITSLMPKRALLSW